MSGIQDAPFQVQLNIDSAGTPTGSKIIVADLDGHAKGTVLAEAAKTLDVHQQWQLVASLEQAHSDTPAAGTGCLRHLDGTLRSHGFTPLT